MGETAAIVAIAVSVAAAAVSTYASVKSSEQQAAMAKSVQKQKEIERQAAIDAAAFEETQQRRRTALLLGSQRAIEAASGVETTTGSPLIQEIDLVKQGELEALNIRQAGTMQAGARQFEANIARYRAETAKGAIPLQIAGGVLQAASSGYSTYQLSKYGSYRAPSPRGNTVATDWLMAR